MERKYARQLNRYYRYLEGKLVFEDRVTYTVKEALLISRSSPRNHDCEAIHLVKAVFGGEVISFGPRRPSPVAGGRFTMLPLLSCRGAKMPEKAVVYNLRKGKTDTRPDAETIELEL